MSTLGINTRVWVAWFPASPADSMFIERLGDPRLQYATIMDGPAGVYWYIHTDNNVKGWASEDVLWPVGGEPMDIPENQDVTRPVEEHSNQ